MGVGAEWRLEMNDTMIQATPITFGEDKYAWAGGVPEGVYFPSKHLHSTEVKLSPPLLRLTWEWNDKEGVTVYATKRLVPKQLLFVHYVLSDVQYHYAGSWYNIDPSLLSLLREMALQT